MPTFTPRIIDHEDGTYTVEYWWDVPGYIDDCWAKNVSLEKARAAADRWKRLANGETTEKIVK